VPLVSSGLAPAEPENAKMAMTASAITAQNVERRLRALGGEKVTEPSFSW
jgi:hypothetical protein